MIKERGGAHTNVSSEDVLKLLLLETAFDDQTTTAINTATGAQFGEQELHNVVVGTLHTLADIGDVGEDSTTVTFTQTLGRRNLIRLGTAGQDIGVVALNEGEESGDKQRVGDGLRCVVGPDTSSGLVIALGNLLGLLSALLCRTSLGQLSLEIGRVDLLGLLFLLFQGGGVEFAVGCWGSFVTFAGFCILGLLRLLLL
jgi:hypothetical protein